MSVGSLVRVTLGKVKIFGLLCGVQDEAYVIRKLCPYHDTELIITHEFDKIDRKTCTLELLSDLETTQHKGIPNERYVCIRQFLRHQPDHLGRRNRIPEDCVPLDPLVKWAIDTKQPMCA